MAAPASKNIGDLTGKWLMVRTHFHHKPKTST